MFRICFTDVEENEGDGSAATICRNQFSNVRRVASYGPEMIR